MLYLVISVPKVLVYIILISITTYLKTNPNFTSYNLSPYGSILHLDRKDTESLLVCTLHIFSYFYICKVWLKMCNKCHSVQCDHVFSILILIYFNYLIKIKMDAIYLCQLPPVHKENYLETKIRVAWEESFLTNLCSQLLTFGVPDALKLGSRSMKIDQLFSNSQVLFHLWFLRRHSAILSSIKISTIKIPFLDLSLAFKHQSLKFCFMS